MIGYLLFGTAFCLYLYFSDIPEGYEDEEGFHFGHESFSEENGEYSNKK